MLRFRDNESPTVFRDDSSDALCIRATCTYDKNNLTYIFTCIIYVHIFYDGTADITSTPCRIISLPSNLYATSLYCWRQILLLTARTPGLKVDETSPRQICRSSKPRRKTPQKTPKKTPIIAPTTINVKDIVYHVHARNKSQKRMFQSCYCRHLGMSPSWIEPLKY